MSSKIIPIFDYIITKLNKELLRIADEAGQKPSSNFKGEAPTIYASNLSADGRIKNGTNLISIGTNASWRFEISTVMLPPPRLIKGRFWYPEGRAHFASINITTEIPESKSVLAITPCYIPFSNSENIKREFASHHVSEDFMFNEVTIQLTLTNGLNIDETMSLDEDYTNHIDKAIRSLIAAQDQQAPLPAKEK